MNQNRTGDYNPLQQEPASTQQQQANHSPNQPLSAHRPPSPDMPQTPHKSKKIPLILGSLTLLAFGGIGWVAYEAGFNSEKNNVPIVAAESDVIKVRPENPEGQQMPHQNKRVYSEIEKTPAHEKPAPYDFSKQVQTAETPLDEAMTSHSDAAGQKHATQTAPPKKTEIIQKKLTSPKNLAEKETHQSKPKAPKTPEPNQSEKSNKVQKQSKQAASMADHSKPQKPMQPSKAMKKRADTAAMPQEDSKAQQAIARLGSDMEKGQQKAKAFSFSSYTRQAEPAPHPKQPEAPQQQASSPTQQQETNTPFKPAANLSQNADARFLIQVGAVKSEAQARSEWQTLTQKFSNLDNLTFHTEPVVVNGGTLHRIRGGMLTKAQAMTICDHLKQNNVACFVVKK